MTIFASLLVALGLAAAQPGPRSASPEDVRRWEQAYLDEMDYFRMEALPDAVVYLRPVPGQDLRQDLVRVWVRYEQFVPRRINGHDARSLRFVQDVDCRQGRVRDLTAEGFPGLNLSGTPDAVQMDARWKTPDPGMPGARQIAFICQAKQKMGAGPPGPAAPQPPSPSMPTAEPAAGQPPPPRSTSDTDVEAWIAAYIDRAGAYQFEYLPNAVVYLYAPEDLQPGKIASVQVRHEYFRPIQAGGRSIRSDRMSYEFDCARGIARLLWLKGYRALNEQDEVANSQIADPKWGVPGAGSEAERQLALICREAREPGYALTVQKGAPAEPEERGPPRGRVIPRRR